MEEKNFKPMENTIPRLNLFTFDSFRGGPEVINERKNSNDSDMEEEQKDQISSLAGEPSPKKSNLLSVLQQPILKRFSTSKSPRKSAVSILEPNMLEEGPKNLQRHSRKSVLNNLEDFLTDFTNNSNRESFDKEALEKRKKDDRENLYDYLQYYMKLDLEEAGEKDENNVGIHEDEERENLIKEVNDIPALYKQKFKAGLVKECAFLQVAKMNEIEKLKVDYGLYPDNLPLLWVRRNFLLSCKYFSIFSKKIVKSTWFQLLSILIILLNCLTYSLISNRSNHYENYADLISLSRDFFLFFYIVEMGLKVFAFGLFAPYNSYFRDGWNWLDFIVIITLIVTYTDVKSLDISLLRLLRLLKPPRDHLVFGPFRIIVSALFSSLPLLFVAFSMLIFFYLFYAIAGLQIFSGILKQRCFQNETGFIYLPDGNDYLCGNLKCPDGFTCGKMLNNPYLGVINFDNFFFSVIQTLLIVTLDNWTTIMYSIQKVFSNFAWVYFVTLVIVGNYFLISLTLAVIKVKFSESHKHLTDSLSKQRRSMKGRTYIELAELKKEGTWDSRKIQRKFKNNNVSPYKWWSGLYIFEVFRMIRMFVFAYYRNQNRRGPKPKLIEKKPSTSFSEFHNSHNQSSTNPSNRFRFLDIGSKILKFFLVGKKTLLRVKSDRIDEDTEAHYLKIRVNNVLVYESPSQYDVMESLMIKEMILHKKRRFFNQEHGKTEYHMKKNDNYFVDFLSYITKKKKVKIKTMKKAEFISNFMRQRGASETPFAISNMQSIGNSKIDQTITGGTKKSFSEYMETEMPGSPRKSGGYKKKKSLAVHPSSRLEEANTRKKSMMAQIEQDEAFVLSYKRNSGRNSSRSFGKMSQSGMSLMYASRIRDSSPNHNMHIFNRLRNNKSFKSTDSEYAFLKEFVCAQIENDDHLERNKAMETEMAFKDRYDSIMFPMDQAKVKSNFVWSGQDILGNYNLDHMEKIIESLNINDLERFLEESSLKFRFIRDKVRIILDSFLSENLMIYTVLCYIILLATEGLLEDATYNSFDLIFTIIFTIEIFLKFVAYGFKGFFTDHINRIDLFIIFISYVQILIVANFTFLLKYVRFLTAFKVLRITRLSRKSKFIKFIISIVMQTISSFIYLFVLLILFNFVYALIGMQLFGGTFPKTSVITNNFSFDTFWISFITVFDIITLDNWIDILALGFNSKQGQFETALFIISWIFLGYFVLLNLFLAILLDGFAEKLNEKDALQMQTAELDDQSRNSRDQQEFKFIVDREAGEVILGELAKFKGENAKEFANNINIDRYMRKPSIPNTNRRKNSYRSKTQIKSFENVFCLNSFYLFSKDNPFRILVYRLISHRYFDTFMICVLVFSSLLLVFDTYLEDNSTSEAEMLFLDLSLVSNAILCFIFGVEVFLKGISYGFVLDKRSYMRNAWNVLDFFLTICYIVDIFTPDRSESQMIQGFKVMKIFRPLKFVGINRNIRTVVQSLIKSAYAIANVFFLILVIWLIFGILGIILFRDRFGYCDNKLNFGVNKEMCAQQNLTWIVDENNFNNIFKASLTLFIVGTLDGWSAIMYTAANSDIESKGPIQSNNEYSAYIFFLSFIFFGQLFLMNLFIGVIFYEFSRETQRSKHKFLDQSQIWWIKLQKKIVAAQPDFSFYKPPANGLRRFLFQKLNTCLFKTFITLSICLDIVILGIFNDNARNAYVDILETFHAVLNLLFLLETCLKYYAYGRKNFFHDFWHKLEFFISLTIIVDLGVFFYYDTIFYSIQYLSRIIKAMRVFKMIRMVRIIYRINVVQRLLQTLKLSIPMVLNISSLLMLTYYIYVLFGCHYFRNIRSGSIIDDYINFKNFSYSLMTMFKVSTADGWENIMFDVMTQYGWAWFYFVSFYFITTDLMINLFILTLITQFEESNQNSDNPLYSFADNLTKFRKAWSTISVDPHGLVIHRRELAKFLRALGLPLGFSKHEEQDTVFKEIMLMNIPTDQRGFIFFNDVLFGSMKRLYYCQVIKNPTDFAKRKMEQTERKTLMKLEIKKKQYRGEPSKIRLLSTQNHRVNPLANFLYSRLSLSLWRKYTEKVFLKLQNPQDEFFESSSDSKENDFSFDVSSSSSSIDEPNSNPHNGKKKFVSELPTPMKISVNLDSKPEEKTADFKFREGVFVLPNGVYEEKN